MPNVVPPMAKTDIRIGIIHRSLPCSLRINMPMPAWIAPVFIVIPMKPPITRMNRATSMAPNSSPLLNTSTLPVAESSMPYRPLIGASSESTTMRCGLESTSWYEPGIGDPSGSSAYRPAGMIHVAIAMTTMSPKRIVYADGSVKRDFVGSPGSAGPPPPLPVSTTCVAPTAVSVSLDMDFSFGGNEDRWQWRACGQRRIRHGHRSAGRVRPGSR